MADAVVVDTWDAKGVRVSDVVDALAELRHQSSGAAAARTAVMTLIAVSEGDEHTYEARRALRALGGHHPARIVLVRPEPDQVATLDGRAALYSIDLPPEGHNVYFEEVTLTVGGQAANHLDSVVEAFTLSDLPVAVWYVGTVPDPRDPLLSVATAVLVDSRDAATNGQLRDVLELARRRTVVDLSWIRLGPWRELAAACFDPPAARSWVGSIDSAEVTGKIGPRQLLGGWLLDRLRLAPNQVRLVDARHVEILITARRDGTTATFEVGRGSQARTVTGRAVVPGRTVIRQSIPLADDPLATSLAEALTHLEPDAIWEHSLSAAITITP